MMNTFPTLFQPSFIIAARWPGLDSSAQKYAGLPSLASANPERKAKNKDINGWNTNLNFMGPLTRAIRLVPTRAHRLACSISSPEWLPHTHRSRSNVGSGQDRDPVNPVEKEELDFTSGPSGFFATARSTAQPQAALALCQR